MKQKILKNTFYTGLSTSGMILLNIFLTPYIISRLGISLYGVWVLILLIVDYCMWLDLGVQSGFVKYIAEFYTKKEWGNLNGVVSVGVLFYALMGLLVIGGLFCIKGFLFTRFHIPGEFYDEYIFVLFLGAITFIISNIFSVFNAIPSGIQRMEVNFWINGVIMLIGGVGTIIALENGYGIRGLMVNQLIRNSTGIAINYMVSKKCIPTLQFSFKTLNKHVIKEIFIYGYKFQIIRLASLSFGQIDKLLVSYYVGMGSLTFYDVGNKVAYVIRQCPYFLFRALTPAFSTLDAKKDVPSVQHIYIAASRYLAFYVFFISFFVICNAKEIMYLWLGQGFDQSVLVVQIITAGYIINLLTGPGTSLLQGIAQFRQQIIYCVVVFVLNVILGIVLVQRYGLWGAAMASAIGLTVGSVYFLIQFHAKIIPFSLSKLVRSLYAPPLLCSIFVNLIFFVVHRAYIHIVNLPRWTGAGILCGGFLVIAVVYGLLLIGIKALDWEELKLIFQKRTLQSLFKIGE